jgi:hypothetical protein
MIKVPPRLAEPPMDRARDLTCCMVLRAIYALETAHFKVQVVGRKGWRASAQLVEAFCLAGRPVLFLYLLCLVAAGLLAPVGAVPAIAFLLAGCSAVVAFVVLARPSVETRRMQQSGGTERCAGLFMAPGSDEANVENPDAKRPAACEGIAENGLLR